VESEAGKKRFADLKYPTLTRMPILPDRTQTVCHWPQSGGQFKDASALGTG
jgi:hypothetical protein